MYKCIRCDNDRYKIGFTLAEVLITLAVIGIVAAMSIPSLMNTIDNMHYRQQFKKTYSELSGTTNLIKNDNGETLNLSVDGGNAVKFQDVNS